MKSRSSTQHRAGSLITDERLSYSAYSFVSRKSAHTNQSESYRGLFSMPQPAAEFHELSNLRSSYEVDTEHQIRESLLHQGSDEVDYEAETMASKKSGSNAATDMDEMVLKVSDPLLTLSWMVQLNWHQRLPLKPMTLLYLL
jgi:hypothetical protein